MQGLRPVNSPPSETIPAGQKRRNEGIQENPYPENPYKELERIITLEKKSLEDTNKKVIEITHNIETRARKFTQAKPNTRDNSKTINAITRLKAKNNEYQCLINTQKDQRDKIDELEKAKTKPEVELKTIIKNFIEDKSLPTVTFSEEENNEIMKLFKEWDKKPKKSKPNSTHPRTVPMAEEGGSAAGGRAMPAGQMGLAEGGRAMPAGRMGLAEGGRAMPAEQIGSNAGGRAMPAGQIGSNAGGRAMPAGQMGSNAGGRAIPAGQMGSNAGGWAMLAGQIGSNAGGRTMPAGQIGSNAGGRAMPAGQIGSAAGDRMIPQSKQPLRLTQLINDDDPNFKKLKTVTKHLNNAQNFDEKLNRLGEFIRWHDDLTKAQSRLSSIKYWSWLILYTKITTLTEMCLSRNKQNNRIEGINQTNINKIKELFQMSPLNKRVPVDDAGNFVSYIINGIKENETVNFRKFFADQSGGKFIFDQLEEYNRQLKNDPTEQQKKAIQSYINCKETQEFLTLLTEYSSDGAHPLPWVNKIKYELLNIQRLIDSKPIQIEEKTTISQDEFSKKDPIDSTKSHEIWNELKELGILNSNGTISEQLDKSSSLDLKKPNKTYGCYVLDILKTAKEKGFPVSIDAFIKKSNLTSSQSKNIWKELNEQGILDETGTITIPHGQPIDDRLHITLSKENEEHRDHILRILNDRNAKTQIIDD